MKKTKSFCIRIDPILYKKVKIALFEEEKFMSDWLREKMIEYLESKEKK